MFGRRPDGRRLKGIDPIITFTPYIMPTRVDSQVNIKLKLDFDGMTKYIREQRAKGHKLTYMSLILAAYVRTISQYPALNRFIMNKQIFARNHLCVSFVTLKKEANDEVVESVVKVAFDPNATVYDVNDRVEAAIAENRVPSQKNGTDKLVNLLLRLPGLATCVVALAKVLDRYGLLPNLISNLSPFHTSMFISNMASIGMGYIYHHIYNFGTTSVFISMGKTEDEISLNTDGSCRRRRIMPLGVVIDERIAAGGTYAQALGYLQYCINHPETLEVPPEKTLLETKMKKCNQQINTAE